MKSFQKYNSFLQEIISGDLRFSCPLDSLPHQQGLGDKTTRDLGGSIFYFHVVLLSEFCRFFSFLALKYLR